jgi:hypothetical protein
MYKCIVIKITHIPLRVFILCVFELHFINKLEFLPYELIQNLIHLMRGKHFNLYWDYGK